MFIIFRETITSQRGLNIGAEVGTQMFAFMWIGAVGCILGAVVHLGLGCCGASRRDVRMGRRKGSRAGYLTGGGEGVVDEKKRRAVLPKFGRGKTSSDSV